MLTEASTGILIAALGALPVSCWAAGAVLGMNLGRFDSISVSERGGREGARLARKIASGVALSAGLLISVMLISIVLMKNVHTPADCFAEVAGE